MKKTLALASSLLLTSAIMVAQNVLPVKNGDIYILTVGNTEFSIDASMGGRVSSYKLDNKELLFTTPPNDDNGTLYGSVLWPSPQNGGDKGWGWPPSAIIDLNPYEANINENKIIVTSEKDPNKSGLQIKKAYWGNLSDTSITLEYTMINITDAPFSVAPWEVTRVPAEGLTFFPKGDNTITGELGNYYSLLDSHYWYEYENSQTKNKKSLADGKEGWSAFVNAEKMLFIKKFDDTPLSQAAPQEDEIEQWLSSFGYIELENQAAYTLLQPNDSLVWNMKWYLRQLPESIDATLGNPELISAVKAVLDTTTTKVYERKLDLAKIVVYPNPCNGRELSINCQENSLVSIDIYDIKSNLIFQQTFNNKSSGRLTGLNLTTGTYFMKIKTLNSSFVKKLIVF